MKKILLFIFLLSFSFSSMTVSPQEQTCKKGRNIEKWEIRWELARTLSYAGKTEEAELEYEKLIKEKDELIEPKIEILNLYLQQNKRDKADIVINSIPISKLDYASRIEIARFYQNRKNFKKAEEIYKECLGTKEDLSARQNLADLYVLEGKLDKALSVYEFLLKKRPKDKFLIRKYAFVLLKEKKYKEAEKALKRSL